MKDDIYCHGVKVLSILGKLPISERVSSFRDPVLRISKHNFIMMEPKREHQIINASKSAENLTHLALQLAGFLVEALFCKHRWMLE